MQNATSPITSPIRGTYDVVVVGARAAGAATAMLLARRGVRVLAIDRSAYGSDTLSTHNIALAGVLQLSRWGVLDDIREAGTPVAGTVEFNYGAEKVVLNIPARGDVDGLYSPRRTVLDAKLVDAAVASGAQVCHGVSLVDVTRDEAGRVKGVVVDDHGTTRTVSARYVVGADGTRSKVARLVGSEKYHEDEGAGSIYSYWAGLPSDKIVNFYEVGKAGGIIPTNDGVAVAWTAISPADFQNEARGDLAGAHHERIDELAGLRELLAGAQRVGGYRGHPGLPGYLRQPYGPGWALVGDAGYFKDPVSAHGITDAFIGAEMVADALADVLRCGVDENVALARYGTDRETLASEMMPPVAKIASLEATLPEVAESFKAMAVAMRHEFGYLSGKASPAVAA
jgi:flavin-dependent dehydrogenase